MIPNNFFFFPFVMQYQPGLLIDRSSSRPLSVSGCRCWWLILSKSSKNNGLDSHFKELSYNVASQFPLFGIGVLFLFLFFLDFLDQGLRPPFFITRFFYLDRFGETLFSCFLLFLAQIFEPFGPVELVQLPLDLETGQCKGFGFVQVCEIF